MANSSTRRCGRFAAAALAVGVAAASLCAVGARPAEAGRAQVLGAAKPAAASCPETCMVEARVTGFETRIGRQKNPFSVPEHGRIVAWSIKLGSPAKTDLQYFNERFGASQARISILKPIKLKRKKKVKVRYKLLRQGPVQALQPFFGETTSFGLAEPLRVRKGNVVALTLPTWAPAFAIGQEGSRWRASRAPSADRGDCTVAQGQANVRAGEAHDQTGTQRPYACAYRGARLLYSARFVADGKRGK
jgi:hypothetical protein